MTLVVLAFVTAVVLALIFRGRPSTLLRPAVRRAGLLGIVAISLVTSLLAKSTGVSVGWLVLAALALVWFAALNRGRPGIGLMLVGLGLNCLVALVNGGMPVSVGAVERAGVPSSRVPLDTDPLREELTDETVLPWLGEVIPLALPLRPAVASAGDVLVGAGAALFIFTGLTGFGRDVPQRVLTPKEKRAARKSRKAARREARAERSAAEPDSAAEVPVAAGTGGAVLADASMRDNDESLDEERPSALLVSSAAVVHPVPEPSTPQPPSVETADDVIGEAAQADLAPTAVDPDADPAAVPLDPAAAAAQAALAHAQAERKRAQRQFKKVKKVERKRRKAVAELLEGAEGPVESESSSSVGEQAEEDDWAPADKPASPPPGPRDAEVPPPVEVAESGSPEPPLEVEAEPDPTTLAAHASVGATRARSRSRAKPPVNGASEDVAATSRPSRRRARRAVEGTATSTHQDDLPTPAPAAAAPVTDRPVD